MPRAAVSQKYIQVIVIFNLQSFTRPFYLDRVSWQDVWRTMIFKGSRMHWSQLKISGMISMNSMVRRLATRPSSTLLLTRTTTTLLDTSPRCWRPGPVLSIWTLTSISLLFTWPPRMSTWSTSDSSSRTPRTRLMWTPSTSLVSLQYTFSWQNWWSSRSGKTRLHQQDLTR